MCQNQIKTYNFIGLLQLYRALQYVYVWFVMPAEDNNSKTILILIKVQ